MRIMTRALVFFAVLGGTHEGVFAADEEDILLSYGDEEFISIATGRRQPISKAPAVASVITAEEIRALGARSLDEVLEAVPGLHVSVSSTRFSPVYVIRGIHTDKNPQVLMLINGVPWTQLYFGDRGANSNLPVESIQRLEVIRGPGSAVYGADAFSGVINVITKSAADITEPEAGVRFASFDTQDVWYLHGGKWGRFDVAFMLEGSHTNGDGDRVIHSDAQTIFDEDIDTSASLAPGSLSTRQERLDLRFEISGNESVFRFWNWRQNDVGVGPGLAQALDPTGRGDANNYLIDYTYQPTNTAHWDSSLRLSYMDINTRSRQRLFPAGTELPIGTDGNIDPASGNLELFDDGLIGNPEGYEEHYKIDASTFYLGFANRRIRLAAGAGYAELTPKESKNFGPGVTLGELTDITGTSSIYIREKSRNLYYASIQDEWSFAPDWDLTTGIRYDEYSDFGSTINPRLALVWKTRQDLTTKLLYGRAFRAPSFAELFAINNPVVLGNPELEPEVINTLELAFDYQPYFNMRTGLNLFAYQIDDLIQFVQNSGGGATAQNTGGIEAYGLEFEMAWDLSKHFSLQGHYAFQRATDRETSDAVANAPKHQAYLAAKWHLRPRWLVSAEFSWTGERPRDPADPRDALGSYVLVDLVARARASEHWSISGGVKNLLDDDAREPSPYEPSVRRAYIQEDYPLSGRSYFIEARYTF